MTLSEIIAKFAIETPSSSIPAQAMNAARDAIVDCLSCIVAGAETDVGRIVRKIAAEGSIGPASVIGTNLKIRPRDAALANGTAAHALDLDDVNWTMYGHPSVTIVPACFAIAEAHGLSGRDLIEAYAIGVQVSARFGQFVNPLHYEHGWHSTATVGTFGATAAVCRLLKLDVAKTAMAIGIAASDTAGVRRNFGSMSKPFHAGRAAHGAILAATLASEGMTSSIEALDGKFGWLEVLATRKAPTAKELQDALSSGWDVVEPGIVFKRYAACGAIHCGLDAILELKDKYNITAKDVASIECWAHPFAKMVLQHSRPKTGLEGKFSMEYSLAIGLIAGHPGLEHYEDDWAKNADVRALLEKITFADDATLSSKPWDGAVPARVVLNLVDGRRIETTVEVPIGDPRKPVSGSDRRRKFDDCIAKTVAPNNRALAWRALEKLEGETNLSSIANLLAGETRDGKPRAA